MSAIEAFVTNLGRYNEGYLDGEFLKLPATTEEVQALFQRIHVDGVRYEEIFITDYETDVSGLYDCLSEYADLDDLNYLAALLDDLDEGDREKFEAALSYGDYTGSLKDLINLAQNLDCYEYYPGICDEDDLGRYMIDEMGSLEVSEYLENYIDYEAYGRDVSLEDGGTFTENGYIVNTGDSFIEQYNGRDDLPEEYKIFAYPAPEKSIRDTLKQYKQMIDAAPVSPKDRPAAAHEER
ncbi:antirestriction protein ArdA [Caproiciproducens galactitolivorans]|uniref:Antirestriction protein ArdA n=1 Tax=Caproiciproducens galactitolivorans TaxID=642589 RepID=A0ABT4BUQ7_9FIRM|nr:antirestriction protein ArdA [Caproiciproducens galactitolivorans]MCY1714631.1 antirestriction protein ArdA [Caproiciproducens galactitolivorans]